MDISKKRRRDEIELRLLEIDAKLKDMKRMWLVDGTEGPRGVRATLEAESAQLSYEKHKVILEIHAEKKSEQLYRRFTFTAALVRILQEQGLNDLVVEAERIAVTGVHNAINLEN